MEEHESQEDPQEDQQGAEAGENPTVHAGVPLTVRELVAQLSRMDQDLQPWIENPDDSVRPWVRVTVELIGSDEDANAKGVVIA